MQCPNCGSDIVGNECPKCDLSRGAAEIIIANRNKNRARTQKSKIIQIVALTISMILIIFIIHNTVSKEQGDQDKKSSSQPRSQHQTSSVVVNKEPADSDKQQVFEEKLLSFSERYIDANNDVEKSIILEESKRWVASFCSAHDGMVKDWRGKLRRISSIEEGRAAAISIYNDSMGILVSYQTDASHRKSVPMKGSSLYNSLASLREGQTVTFSATFLPINGTAAEDSITDTGRMRAPEWIMIFNSINALANDQSDFVAHTSEPAPSPHERSRSEKKSRVDSKDRAGITENSRQARRGPAYASGARGRATENRNSQAEQSNQSDSISGHARVCTFCKGSGTSDCPHCVDGKKQDIDGNWNQCPHCNGAGYRYCTYCNGDGIRPFSDRSKAQGDCIFCYGSGLSDCPHCVNGRKLEIDGTLIDCPHCSARGTTPCTYCNGTGKR